MKQLIFISLLLLSSLAYGQTRVTTYSVVSDTLRGLNGKDLHLVDTLVFTNGTRIWKAPHFGETITTGNILYGGTHDARYGGVMRNSTLLNFDSTNKRLGVGLVVGSTTSTIHARGASAVSGNAGKFENSTPANILVLPNNGAIEMGDASLATSLTINVSTFSSNMLRCINASSNHVLNINCSGVGYLGDPISLSNINTSVATNGFKFAMNATGANATLNGMYFGPSITAGANNQAMTGFLFRPAVFTAGAFTGTTSTIVDFQNTSGTSYLKIGNAGVITVGTSISSNNSVAATQYISSVDSTNSATVNMTTQSTQKVLSGSSVTTVNFPVGVEGLTITVKNMKAGTITVTVYRDLTGAFSVTQAAQSSIRYQYTAGVWEQLN